MPISIGLDMSPLCGNPVGGIPSFITQVVEHILRLDQEDRFFQCYKFSRIKHKTSLFPVSPNFKRIWYGKRFVFPLRNLDAFHGMAEWLPRSLKIPKIITIHDMRGIRNEKDMDANCIDQYQALKDNSVAIATDSHYIKSQILERLLDVEPSRITVIHLACSRHFRVIETCEKKDQILYVGVITSNKNLLRAVMAFDVIRNQYKETRFIVCGRVGEEKYFQEIMRYINGKPGLSERIQWLHAVDNDALVTLYNESRLCILPSVYEGFGLPVLEAQACGCPMLCSSIGVLSEIGAQGALYCDPEDIESIAEAIKRLLGCGTLQKELIQKGLKNIERFSWEKTAREYVEIYRRVSGK